MTLLEAGQPGFPPELAGISEPPAHLYVRGRIPSGPRLAVVGSRAADGYGLQVAGELAAGLTRAGLVVVSGGAAGVDTAALEACLQAGGQPVAVLGTGPDIAYPVANRRLFERVAEAGALVSEYPPGTHGRVHHFPRRNRIVSGLSSAVIVVQAALRSGSLITARLARHQGRPVLAVPGPVDRPLSGGCHALLRDGARLVETADDVLRVLELGGSGPGKASARPRGAPGGPEPAAARPAAALDPEERSLWEALGADTCPIDLLAERTGWPAARVSVVLLQMECKGMVENRPGMRYRRGVGQGAE